MSERLQDGQERAMNYEQQYKAREAEIRELVRPIINDSDPEQLLSMGLPSDEYEREVNNIAAHITREQGLEGRIKLTPDNLAHIVANVFCLNFRTWTEFPTMHEAYQALGQLIWNQIYLQKSS